MLKFNVIHWKISIFFFKYLCSDVTALYFYNRITVLKMTVRELGWILVALVVALVARADAQNSSLIPSSLNSSVHPFGYQGTLPGTQIEPFKDLAPAWMAKPVFNRPIRELLSTNQRSGTEINSKYSVWDWFVPGIPQLMKVPHSKFPQPTCKTDVLFSIVWECTFNDPNSISLLSSVSIVNEIVLWIMYIINKHHTL